MSCAFSKELLALHVECDLTDPEERVVVNHVRECEECGNFLNQLRIRQSQLRSLRRETIHPSEFVSVRQDVMSKIQGSSLKLGWAVRTERALFLGLRQHVVVFACLVVAVISATMLAQMRVSAPHSAESTLIAGGDTLILPDGYRNWVSVSNVAIPTASSKPNPHVLEGLASELRRNIYINRSAYQGFTKTGKFPEGAILIMEIRSSSSKQPLALEASVKDGRFGGGWGFFDFAGSGVIKDKASALPAQNACRKCHEERAKTDHVFTEILSAT